MNLISKSDTINKDIYVNGNHLFGPDLCCIMAGPCAAESRDQIMFTAEALANLGIKVFRAGCFKSRTDPHSFQGMELDGLNWLDEARQSYGLNIITEVADSDHFDEIPVVSSTALIGTTVSTTATKAKIIKWKVVKDAAKIVVSYRQAGSTVWTNVSVDANSTSYKTPNLNPKYAYEFKVTAYARANGKYVEIVASPSVFTAVKSSSDAKSIKVKSSSVTLKKGKTSKIKAKIRVKGKDSYSSKYVSKLRYVSSDTSVATVTDSGVIKAKSKGKAIIYVMTANGKTARVKITVK